jgi:N utilization substance protein B
MDWEIRDSDEAVDDYWAKFAGEKPESYDEVRTHCAELVRGVLGNRAMLDKRISAASHHWKLDRMSAVDRNILRLATFELVMQADQVPRKVAINEAIEIAKKFGNEDSSAFVNGILDRISADMSRGTEARDKTPRAAAKPKARPGQDAANKATSGQARPAVPPVATIASADDEAA